MLRCSNLKGEFDLQPLSKLYGVDGTIIYMEDGQDRRELIKENITRSNPFSALVHGTHRSTHDNWLLVFITSDNVDNRFFAVIFATVK